MVQLPWDGVAETKSTSFGSVSSTVTPFADSEYTELPFEIAIE